MTYQVSGQSVGGHGLYVAVVNDLETAQQRQDYANWQQIRAVELTDPAKAQQLLASFGDNVKMPIYVEANINGNEYEGTDAIMQVVRDLTVTPLGQNATVDDILNHAILVVVPTSNPDGRIMGVRGDGGGTNTVPGVADTNRDYFQQAMPEEQIDAAIQQQCLATGRAPPARLRGPDAGGRRHDAPQPRHRPTTSTSTWNTARHSRPRLTSRPPAADCRAPCTTGTRAAARPASTPSPPRRPAPPRRATL